MNKLAELCRRIFHLPRRSEFSRELTEEMHHHLALKTDENIRAGMSAEDARYLALREFGNATLLNETSRTLWSFRWIEELLQDIRYGLRILRKSPGFTAVAVITLALGIGANTAIFSVVDSVLLSPPPFPDPQQLVVARSNDSLQNIIDTRKGTSSFLDGGGVNITAMDYTGGVEPVHVPAAYMDAGLFSTLGVPAALGRTITPEEDVKGGPRNIVISDHFWRQFLSGDPHALGKSIQLSGNSYTVIGVMPPTFALPAEQPDIFVSLWVAYPEAAPYRGVHFMRTYWRLKPGVTLAQAQADVSAEDARLAAAYPDTETRRKSTLIPLQRWLAGDVRPALLVLFGAVALVLLIACANFSGLLMARAISRRQEFVIRASIGAGRFRLARQTLTESAVLAIIGGSVGLALAEWGTKLLVSLEPSEMARFGAARMNLRVFLFVFAISLLTGLLSGLIPAASASRADVAESLKENSRSVTAGRAANAWRQLLVAGEFAVAMVLLVGAGLLVKDFSRLRAVNPGFNPANLTTMFLQLPVTRFAEIPPQTVFRREVLARLNALPGVEAAMISDLPFSGNYLDHALVIQGRPPVPAGAEPDVQTLSVMGDYFGAMQMPILAGRGFTPEDRESQPLVAVVNQEFVRKFFPHENPVGHQIDWGRTQTTRRWMTIVGVVADVKHSGLNQPVDPAVYAPFPQSDEAWRRWMSLVIRTQVASPGLVAEVKKQIWSVDDQIPVSQIQTMESMMGDSLAQQRFDMLLLGLFAALALILAAVGIYGMMAHRVGQRLHDIGIYIALGAQPRDVLQLVLRDGAKLALAGIALGLACSFAFTRLMSSLLSEVSPTDPATLAIVALLLAAVGMAACYIPARRAVRVDPVVALRHE